MAMALKVEGPRGERRRNDRFTGNLTLTDVPHA
jgi:hypothetical protein